MLPVPISHDSNTPWFCERAYWVVFHKGVCVLMDPTRFQLCLQQWQQQQQQQQEKLHGAVCILWRGTGILGHFNLTGCWSMCGIVVVTLGTSREVLCCDRMMVISAARVFQLVWVERGALRNLSCRLGASHPSSHHHILLCCHVAQF